jgi:hypothetical protein
MLDRLTALGRGPRLFGAVLLSVLALIPFGCGGGSTGISREEFVKEASSVCRKTGERIQSEFTAYGKSREGREDVRAEEAGELTFREAAIGVANEIVIPAMRRQLAELRALGVPEGDEGRAKALLDAFGEGVEKAEKRPERAAQDGTEAFGRQERLADEYGLQGC